MYASLSVHHGEQVHGLAKASATYEWIYKRIVPIKWGLYGTAVLLNLNVGMAT